MKTWKLNLCIFLASLTLLVLPTSGMTQHQSHALSVLSSTTDAQDVELVGHIGGATSALFVQGDYAYIGVGPRLTILDISNPISPTMIGETSLFPDVVQGICISGDYAYVANGDEGGLRVVDVSTPSNPSEVGSCDTPGEALSVHISGTVALVADGGSGLQVIDVSTPDNPAGIGSYDTSTGYARDVYFSGDNAYVADSGNGLVIVDVSDPTNPAEIGSYDTPGYAQGVHVSGNNAYVADGGTGLQIVDVRDPENPAGAGSCDTPGYAKDVYVNGDAAYLADAAKGLRVMDVSDPDNPYEDGSYDTPGEAEEVHVSGNNAYIADYSSGMRVVNVSDPVNPTESSSYDPMGEVWDVHVSGSNAYIADKENGLRVVDVDDPANPAEIGSYNTPGDAYGLYVSGSIAYVADRGSGLRMIDVSDPTNPTEDGFYDTPGEARGVHISGATAYVAYRYSGLRVVDVSDPTNPSEVGSYDTPGAAGNVYVNGDTAYVADGYSGLRVVDVSTPTSPSEIGSYDTSGLAEGVYVSGSIAYVADGDLQILDVSDPTSPAEITSYETPGSVEGVYVSGNAAYVADGSSGLRVVDVSDPAHPTEIGYYNTAGSANNVHVIDGVAYVADDNAGLIILRPTLDAPTLDPIANADGDGDYTVDWSDVVGANSYTLEEDDNASFTTPTTCYSGGDVQYTVSGQATGVWYYRVRASNTARDSEWSNVESTSVKPDAPTLYAISNPNGDSDYTVDWSDVTGAISYTLQEDDNTSFTNPITIYNGSDSQYSVSGQTVGTWYYQVKASNSAGDSEWSNVESTSVYTPMSNVIINGPMTGVIKATYTFTATVSPSAVTPPITYSWQATGQDDVIKTTEASSHTITFTWGATGIQAITVTATNADGTVSNTHAITISEVPTYAVSLNKNVEPIVTTPGQRITYTLDYSNTGDFTIFDVTITDTMPLTLTDISYVSSGAQITPTGSISFTWQVGDLEVGEGGTITVTATVDPSLTEDVTIANYATIADGMGQVRTSSSVTATVVVPESKVPWTVIVYLNGDDKWGLDPETVKAFNYLEIGACNLDVNVAVLWDRRDSTQGTKRYKIHCDDDDLHALPIGYVEGVDTWDDGELNLGDAQTLRWFASWARIKYPAEHYWLSIIDHGGGWSADLPPGMPLACGWYQGGAGLSWDETGAGGDPDYLSTREMGDVLRYLSNEGADPLDIVFYDACLMGMLEEAYEIKEYAHYFVAAESLGWTTFRYDCYINGCYNIIDPITTDTCPEVLAKRIVKVYGDALPNEGGTIAALDLRGADDVAAAVDDMAQALMIEQENELVREQIHEAYKETQKFDYDGDGIEQYREGYVDLYDFARQVKGQMENREIEESTQRVMNTINGFVIAERHKGLNNAKGVSIYLPLGEELYIGGGCDASVLNPCDPGPDLAYVLDFGQTPFLPNVWGFSTLKFPRYWSESPICPESSCIKLRDYYTTTRPPRTRQLSFAQDTNWDEFVNEFIDVHYCNSPESASALRLHRAEVQDLPPIRPIAILSEPRKPLHTIEWTGRPVGGVTIGLNQEHRTLVAGMHRCLVPGLDGPRAVYLPTVLRDR